MHAAAMLARSRSVPEAFAGFVEGVRPQMLRFFAKRIGNPQRAADLTAQTVAKAFERRADFRGVTDEQAYGWIWGIARHELTHALRSEVAEGTALLRFSRERHETMQESELARIERDEEVREIRAALLAALIRLPRDQRDVVALHYLHELSYEEVALRLGVSNAVIRARASRALRALRRDKALAGLL